MNITLTPFPPDDPYEDDDTMSYGTLITANFSDTLSLVDDDNFNITVAMPTLLNITLEYVTSHENIYWHLRHPDDVVVASGFDLEFLYVCSEAGSYYYETSLLNYAVIESYTITITLTPLPPDDGYEDNDNAAQAVDATGGF